MLSWTEKWANGFRKWFWANGFRKWFCWDSTIGTKHLEQMAQHLDQLLGWKSVADSHAGLKQCWRWWRWWWRQWYDLSGPLSRGPTLNIVVGGDQISRENRASVWKREQVRSVKGRCHSMLWLAGGLTPSWETNPGWRPHQTRPHVLIHTMMKGWSRLCVTHVAWKRLTLNLRSCVLHARDDLIRKMDGESVRSQRPSECELTRQRQRKLEADKDPDVTKIIASKIPTYTKKRRVAWRWGSEQQSLAVRAALGGKRWLIGW